MADGEDEDDDWLAGGGLKFQVDSSRAYLLDEERAKKNLDIFDPLGLVQIIESLSFRFYIYISDLQPIIKIKFLFKYIQLSL